MSSGITSQIASGAVTSLTGNIENALLVIHDYRDAIKGVDLTKKNDRKDMLTALSSERVAATKLALETGTAPSFPNSRDKIFNIHFNPSQLTLNASSIPKHEKDIVGEGSLSQAPEDPQLYLTTVLYFDDMDTYDSFMGEKFTSGLSAKGINNIAKGIKDIADTKKSHSVLPQVESLISALRNPFTRTISFRWNSFSFIGQLTTVRAKYTMFSTSGKPVRAEVLLRMQHELDPTLLNNWYEDFDKAFGRTSTKSASLMKNTSNLLNLNL